MPPLIVTSPCEGALARASVPPWVGAKSCVPDSLKASPIEPPVKVGIGGGATVTLTVAGAEVPPRLVAVAEKLSSPIKSGFGT